MVTQAPKRSSVLIATAFVLSCIGLMIFVWTQFGGTIPFSPAGYRIQAVFPETGQLVSGADVRISGVNVGKVTGVQAQGVNSLVTMDIRQQYAPVPADTRAVVRLKTLLGEAYIELSTGTRSGPALPDGGTIPRDHIEPTVSLDQALNSFDPSTQRALQEFLDGSFSALAGRGQDLNFAFGNLDPTITELSAVVGELNQQQDNVKSLISNLGLVTTTLGSRSADLQSLVTAGDRVFSATAARDTALTQTVDRLPAFMAELRTTLTTLNGTLGLAKPDLAAIKVGAPFVRPALSELVALSGPALSLLHQAPHLIGLTNRALPAISRFAVAFNAVLQPILNAAEQIVPVINFIQLYPRELIAAFANLPADLNASAPTSSGAIVKYIRGALTLNNEGMLGQTERPSSNRHNPYISPGGLAQVAQGGLLSSDCNNIHDSSPVGLLSQGNVPCRLQPKYPWPSNAASNGPSYFPHVTAAKP
jgi:phospholipid/cholesterol/gamma-HCH transport system substrate-binding protein